MSDWGHDVEGWLRESSGDGSLDTRHVPKQQDSVRAPDSSRGPHFEPSAQCFMNFLCGIPSPSSPIITASYTSSSWCPIAVLRLRVTVGQSVLHWCPAFLMVFCSSNSIVLTVCCTCVLSTSCVILRREKTGLSKFVISRQA